MTVGAVRGVDGDAFNVTFLWSDFAGKVAGECAIGLVLIVGPDVVTVTVSDEFIRVFSIRGGSRTMRLVHLLVKI